MKNASLLNCTVRCIGALVYIAPFSNINDMGVFEMDDSFPLLLFTCGWVRDEFSIYPRATRRKTERVRIILGVGTWHYRVLLLYRAVIASLIIGQKIPMSHREKKTNA